VRGERQEAKGERVSYIACLLSYDTGLASAASGHDGAVRHISSLDYHADTGRLVLVSSVWRECLARSAKIVERR
jgi:hypothetical protein